MHPYVIRKPQIFHLDRRSMPATGGVLTSKRALKARGWTMPLIFIAAFPRKSVERRAMVECA
jgi:hypothetical protein